MKGSVSAVLVGRLASTQVAGQQMPAGLCPLRPLQAAGQPRPGLEAAKPALQQVGTGGDRRVAQAAYEVVPAVYDMFHQGQHGRRQRNYALVGPLAADQQPLAGPGRADPA